MKLTPTRLPDVMLIEPRIFEDQRGYFMETWRESVFRDAGIAARFVQENESRSTRGVLRGLHYQVRQPQGKLVRAVTGAVYVVTVDLRHGSATRGDWVGVDLSADNKRLLWVPPGFAHGFFVKSETATYVYKCTDYYAPEHERCIRWDDSDLAIDWPIPAGEAPILSTKDAAGSLFRDVESAP